jgi:hypothetical protein
MTLATSWWRGHELAQMHPTGKIGAISKLDR